MTRLPPEDERNDDLPENFYKLYGKSTNRSAPIAQTTAISNQTLEDDRLPNNFIKHEENRRFQSKSLSKPLDPDTFELEQRLKRLSSSKSCKIPSTHTLEKRLDKLRGLDKPIPTVTDLEARLCALRDEDPSSKKRKVAPIIKVMNTSGGPEKFGETVDDLINEAKAGLNIEKWKGYADQFEDQEEMTPERLKI